MHQIIYFLIKVVCCSHILPQWAKFSNTLLQRASLSRWPTDIGFLCTFIPAQRASCASANSLLWRTANMLGFLPPVQLFEQQTSHIDKSRITFIMWLLRDQARDWPIVVWENQQMWVPSFRALSPRCPLQFRHHHPILLHSDCLHWGDRNYWYRGPADPTRSWKCPPRQTLHPCCSQLSSPPVGTVAYPIPPPTP